MTDQPETAPQWRYPQCGAGEADGCWDLEADGSCPPMPPSLGGTLCVGPAGPGKTALLATIAEQERSGPA